MPPILGCPRTGLPSSEVTGAICRVPSTPFSQAPGYTLPVHLCRFRVRSIRGGCFLEVLRRRLNPIRTNNFRPSSHTRRLGSINPIPIDYGFRPRLRGRLTLRGLTLRRNPWTFGVRVSRPDCRYSCQHSHFRDLQDGSPLSLHRLTERSATASRGQNTETRKPEPSACFPITPQAVQHPRDLLILIAPTLPGWLFDVAEIQCVSQPHPHLVARAHRDRQKSLELGR